MKKQNLHPVIRRFIEDAGRTTQSFGLGRVVGQIYAYLYFSAEPRNLADLQEALGISKGSASTGVRQLEQWDAVRHIWIKGDRKDYYEANDWFGKIVKNFMTDLIGKRMSAASGLLEEADAELQNESELDGEGEFLRKRIQHLQRFQNRAMTAWNNPLIQKFLK